MLTEINNPMINHSPVVQHVWKVKGTIETPDQNIIKKGIALMERGEHDAYRQLLLDMTPKNRFKPVTQQKRDAPPAVSVLKLKPTATAAQGPLPARPSRLW